MSALRGKREGECILVRHGRYYNIHFVGPRFWNGCPSYFSRRFQFSKIKCSRWITREISIIEEIDQHLGHLSDFESVSAASPRQSPQSSITWSDVPSGMTWDSSEPERQSAFGYPTAWTNLCDSTEHSIQVPIMADKGIVYQAAEEECDVCCSYFLSQNSQQLVTDSSYQPPNHLRDSQWDMPTLRSVEDTNRKTSSSGCRTPYGGQSPREKTENLQNSPSPLFDKSYQGGESASATDTGLSTSDGDT